MILQPKKSMVLTSTEASLPWTSGSSQAGPCEVAHKWLLPSQAPWILPPPKPPTDKPGEGTSSTRCYVGDNGTPAGRQGSRCSQLVWVQRASFNFISQMFAVPSWKCSKWVLQTGSKIFHKDKQWSWRMACCLLHNFSVNYLLFYEK